MSNRVIWVVIDSVGMGADPHAKEYDDEGCNTIGHIYEFAKSIDLPNMEALGYGCIDGMVGPKAVKMPKGVYARLAEVSNGKDSTTGHWEMIGIYTKTPFPTYPEGFPQEVIDEFVNRNHLPGILGNEVASGTEIIARLGDEHVRTGKPIIYTSADSVFQIAAHEEVIPIDRLYEICENAREQLRGEHEVARVIARPFVGESGAYTRTSNRHDYSIAPTDENALVYLKDAGLPVISVGKIEDLFCNSGITSGTHTKDNMDGVDVLLRDMDAVEEGLIFANLVEFDSKWGHRRDIEGYAKGLMDWDQRLPEIMGKMREDDILVITADHGCDPAYKGTDHTREYVPLIMYGEKLREGTNLHTVESFASIGQTVLSYLGVGKKLPIGDDLLEKILK